MQAWEQQEGDGGPQSDGGANQNDLHRSGQAGQDVAGHELTHGVGQGHAGDQQHQCTDGDGLQAVPEAHQHQQSGQSGSNAREDRGAEKQVGAGEPAAKQLAQADGQATQGGG